MNANIFEIKETNFVLWRGSPTIPPPQLVIGELQLGAPVSFVSEQKFDLQQAPGFTDLWLIPAASCNLVERKVYHYWFEVSDAHPKRPGKRIRVTDPFALTVDSANRWTPSISPGSIKSGDAASKTMWPV